MTHINCIYIAASTRDARYTRICVASVRYFYPEVPILLLVGRELESGLESELRRYWGVQTADLPRGDYGWGFVKLEALFGVPGQKFLVLDSDTVITGPVLERWRDSDDAHFLVDDETQSEADTKGLYYDWEEVRKIDPCAQPPRFVFNSGQWFGTAGVLTRSDFAPWVEWTLPRQLRNPQLFMPGDQGILNYVVNQKATLEGLQVERQPIMRWPAHSMDGLDAKTVSRNAAPPQIVHWAGLKKMRLRDMLGSDLLLFFEKVYYDRLPAGGAQRVFGTSRAILSQCALHTCVKLELASRKLAMVWSDASAR